MGPAEYAGPICTMHYRFNALQNGRSGRSGRSGSILTPHKKSTTFFTNPLAESCRCNLVGKLIRVTMSRESENKLNCHSLQALAIDASFFVCSVFMVGRACSKYSCFTGNGEGHEDSLSYTRRHIASCKRSQKKIPDW